MASGPGTGHAERERDKWLRTIARQTVRAKLARARRDLKAARQDRRTATKRARQVCAEARASAKAWIAQARAELREEIARLRAELAARIDKRREAVRTCCGTDRQRVRAQHDERVAAARAQLDDLRKAQTTERIWSRPITVLSNGRKARQQRTRENLAEFRSRMEQELSPDEWIVWQRADAKRMIPRATPKVSAVEQFRRWAHDHSAEVSQFIREDADRAVAEAIKREKAERAQLADLKKITGRRMRTLVERELEAVPF